MRSIACFVLCMVIVSSALHAQQVTKIAPAKHYTCDVTQVTIRGTTLPKIVTNVFIGPPVNVTLTNIVRVDWTRINAVVPKGGGVGAGKVLVNGSQNTTATFTNLACWYTITPKNVSVSAAGGTGSVTVKCPPCCEWKATVNP